jgi:hypothetical protein
MGRLPNDARGRVTSPMCRGWVRAEHSGLARAIGHGGNEEPVQACLPCGPIPSRFRTMTSESSPRLPQTTSKNPAKAEVTVFRQEKAMHTRRRSHNGGSLWRRTVRIGRGTSATRAEEVILTSTAARRRCAYRRRSSFIRSARLLMPPPMSIQKQRPVGGPRGSKLRLNSNIYGLVFTDKQCGCCC